MVSSLASFLPLPVFERDSSPSAEIFPIHASRLANVSICKTHKVEKGNMKGLKDSIREQAFTNPKVVPLSSKGIPPSSSAGLDSSAWALREFTTPDWVT